MNWNKENKGHQKTQRAQQKAKILKRPIIDINNKSAKEIYEDIYKTISSSYTPIFENLKSPNKTHKSSIQVPSKFRQSLGNQKTVIEQNKNIYCQDNQFDPFREIQQLNKIGNIFTDESINKQKNNFVSNKFKTSNYFAQKKQKQVQIQQENVTVKSGIKSQQKYYSRATTGKRNKEKVNSIGTQSLQLCKFVKLDRKNQDSQVAQLSKQVEELKNAAVTKYGVSFKKSDPKSQNNIDFFERNQNFNIENVERKLKQINGSKNQEQFEQQNGDSSIPMSMLKILISSKKVSSIKSFGNKKYLGNTYLRM